MPTSLYLQEHARHETIYRIAFFSKPLLAQGIDNRSCRFADRKYAALETSAHHKAPVIRALFEPWLNNNIRRWKASLSPIVFFQL
ncbi:hypothetical protein [Agrobacterium vitis]|uniref:hypothetical protein n=1 Tax=Agrobacterium vitis TaxID=373 RepID=UPI0015D98298|nr:hypothetical protein [Agrobacterium vitis]